MTAEDSQGEERDIVMYWTKTDLLLGRTKAGSARLLTECGVPIRFDQRPEGVLFRGTPGDDALAGGTTPNVSEFECGRFTDHETLTEIQDGRVSFVIECVPVTDEFSAFPRTYIAASEKPYEIQVTSVMERSIFGKTFEGPEPPVCRDHQD
jgi:hypothetical protein